MGLVDTNAPRRILLIGDAADRYDKLAEDNARLRSHLDKIDSARQKMHLAFDGLADCDFEDAETEMFALIDAIPLVKSPHGE